MTRPRPELAPKYPKPNLSLSARDQALVALEMAKAIEREKKDQMKTIFLDDGKTLIRATKDKLDEIVENYKSRKL